MVACLWLFSHNAGASGESDYFPVVKRQRNQAAGNAHGYQNSIRMEPLNSSTEERTVFSIENGRQPRRPTNRSPMVVAKGRNTDNTSLSRVRQETKTFFLERT